MSLRRRAASVLLFAAAVACGTFGADSSPTTSPPSDDGGANDAASDSAADAPACDPGSVANDPHHCGRCGHDCLGGTCVAGTCAPTTLGSAPPGAGIFAIALLPDRVVWAAAADPANGGPNHAVYMCPKTGCAGAASLTAPNQAAGGVASNGVDRTYASFVYNGVNGVFELLPGGQFQRAGGTHVVVHGMMADGDSLHFLALYEPGPSDRSIRRFDHADGGDSTVCVVPQASGGNVENAVYGGGYAYLTAHDSGHITACALAGGAITDYTTATEPISTATTNGDRLFWTGASGVIHSCALGATCATIRDDAVGGAVRDVVASGTDLVFATTAGDLERCTAASCAIDHTVLTHATLLGSSSPVYGHGVATDEVSYFYATSDDPLTDGGPLPTWKLMRLAK